MTTEEDFHAALDAHPDDAHCRRVFADWLQERGDPRAEGYRALGATRRQPRNFCNAGKDWLWHPDVHALDLDHVPSASILPKDWYDALDGGRPFGALVWPCSTKPVFTRRAAEDAAALAFANLPAARRAELLAGVPA